MDDDIETAKTEAKEAVLQFARSARRTGDEFTVHQMVDVFLSQMEARGFTLAKKP